MKMFMLNSLKRNKPVYIVSCDIKSAYDNINQEKLLKHFKGKIISKMKPREDGSQIETQTSTEMLLHYILKAPNVRIYEEKEIIHLTRGVQ
jgi:hypothetical protein